MSINSILNCIPMERASIQPAQKLPPADQFYYPFSRDPFSINFKNRLFQSSFNLVYTVIVLIQFLPRELLVFLGQLHSPGMMMTEIELLER